MTLPLPAYHTKHIPLLPYPFRQLTFHLAQSDDGISNGTALWLGAQCISSYLIEAHTKFRPPNRRPKVIELGSGIGLTALALASLGWDVLATDIGHVISTILARNIERNTPQLPPTSGQIAIRELDWTVLPDQWSWDDSAVIASGSQSGTLCPSVDALCPPFDLIVSADTIYLTSLIEPLLRTLHFLSTSSAASSDSRPPPIILCVEKRDPALLDRVLSEARNVWKFSVQRIPHRKLAKALEKAGNRWDREDWEDVEIWKLILRQK